MTAVMTRTNAPTVKSLLAEAVCVLESAGVATPRLDAEVLLAEAMNVRREALISKPDKVLDADVTQRFREFVERRRQREPVAYILGRKEFWSMEFQVSPDVLIPRPDTECLIEHFLNLVKSQPVPAPRILDMGTGSGILAVVAAREIPDAAVTAIDLYAEGLQIARANAKTHGVKNRIQFVQGDFYQEFPDGEPFDYILSNPPYIDSRSYEMLAPEILNFEPRQALDGGLDGLAAYRGIIPIACRLLRFGGHLILETGDNQAEDVSQMILAGGAFESLKRVSDYTGCDRVVSAKRKIDG